MSIQEVVLGGYIVVAFGGLRVFYLATDFADIVGRCTIHAGCRTKWLNTQITPLSLQKKKGSASPIVCYSKVATRYLHILWYRKLK